MKITHDYTCDHCDKPAKYNVQANWTSYEITPDGDFNEINNWPGDDHDNNFYCAKHFKAFEDGEL